MIFTCAWTCRAVKIIRMTGLGMKLGTYARNPRCGSPGGDVESATSVAIFFGFFFNRSFARVSPVFAVATLILFLASRKGTGEQEDQGGYSKNRRNPGEAPVEKKAEKNSDRRGALHVATRRPTTRVSSIGPQLHPQTRHPNDLNRSACPGARENHSLCTKRCLAHG